MFLELCFRWNFGILQFLVTSFESNILEISHVLQCLGVLFLYVWDHMIFQDFWGFFLSKIPDHTA